MIFLSNAVSDFFVFPATSFYFLLQPLYFPPVRPKHGGEYSKNNPKIIIIFERVGFTGVLRLFYVFFMFFLCVAEYSLSAP